MKLIGFSGRRQSGKTSAAQALSPAPIVRFAGPLKKGIKHMFGFSEEQIYGEKKDEVDPEYGVSPRFIMKKIGTDFARNQIDKDIWVKRLARTLDRLEDDMAIVDDVRFPGEVEFIKNRGGKVIRIIRPGLEREDTHESETALDDYAGWSATIINDYPNVNRFQESVRAIVNRLFTNNLKQNKDSTV